MAQFPLSDLLSGVKRIFVGLQGKKTDGTIADVKISDKGEVFTAAVGSTNLKGTIQTLPTAQTRVALPDYPCRKVTIVALKTNTGSIFLGSNNVSNVVYGVELEGKDSVTIEVSNTNLIYLWASVAGEGVSYVAI